VKVARETVIRCDICKKPTTKIVGKLHFIPAIPGLSRTVHSNYSHHADVGACCKDRLLKGFKFRPRISAKEYHESRKNGTYR
jgi:hypothetical protein